MDIRSKNKFSIGQKLLLSYMLLLFITFLVIVVSFNQITRSYVFDSAEKEITKQASRIANIVAPMMKKLDNDNTNLLSEDALNNTKARLSGLVLNSEVYIVNNKLRLVYGQGKLRANEIRNIIEGDQISIENVVYYIESIKLRNEVLGSVVVITRVEDIRALNQKALSFMLIALGISAVLAVFISFILQRKITNPIKELREELINYKNEEEFLDESLNESRDELEDLKLAFENMTRRIDIYTNNQKSFFQNASHELKTPLMSIQGYAEAIRDGLIEKEELDKSLGIIISESQRLKKIVEEMILMTKLDDANEKFTFKSNSALELINESLNSLNPLLDYNFIEVDIIYSEDILICVDSDKFKRALINIIGNCCRYAKSNISISFLADNGRFYLDIKDDGQGFSPGEEKLVFERFYKGKKGGSGIGLTLAKAIVNRHGGDLTAVNNIGMGALFKIDMPINGNCD